MYVLLYTTNKYVLSSYNLPCPGDRLNKEYKNLVPELKKYSLIENIQEASKVC